VRGDDQTGEQENRRNIGFSLSPFLLLGFW
jgi:hypothetical protein